jgi:hypothetical protein
LPLISPALAVLAAPPSRIAVANTVAAAVRNRMFPPKMMLMVLRLYWKPVGQMRIPRPGAYFLDLDERHPLRVNAPTRIKHTTAAARLCC